MFIFPSITGFPLVSTTDFPSTSGIPGIVVQVRSFYQYWRWVLIVGGCAFFACFGWSHSMNWESPYISLKTNYHTRIVHYCFDTWTFQLHLMTPGQKMVVTYITPFLVWSRGRGDFGKIWGSARRGFDHFIFSSGLGRRFGARNSERPLAS